MLVKLGCGVNVEVDVIVAEKVMVSVAVGVTVAVFVGDHNDAAAVCVSAAICVCVACIESEPFVIAAIFCVAFGVAVGAGAVGSIDFLQPVNWLVIINNPVINPKNNLFITISLYRFALRP